MITKVDSRIRVAEQIFDRHNWWASHRIKCWSSSSHPRNDAQISNAVKLPLLLSGGRTEDPVTSSDGGDETADVFRTDREYPCQYLALTSSLLVLSQP